MQRRIFGIETEFGITCTFHGQRRLTPDEVARYLFRRVVSWGRSSNVFLRNGSRLYLDVGSHPEYATAECDELPSSSRTTRPASGSCEDLLVDAERAAGRRGHRRRHLPVQEQHRLRGQLLRLPRELPGRPGRGVRQDRRRADPVPRHPAAHLRRRQGAADPARRRRTACRQRAEHIWEGVSSATTRSRPIINTRDEPHADAERYRRLHVIVGDSNMSETTTLLKVGSAHAGAGDDRGRRAVAGLHPREPDPGHPGDQPRPHRAPDRPAGRRPGGQRAGHPARVLHPGRRVRRRARQRTGPGRSTRVLELWGRTLDAVEAQDLSLIDREIDWAIKHKLIERYRERTPRPDHPRDRPARPGLPRHPPRPRPVLPAAAQGPGRRGSPTTARSRAKDAPPQTTRAKLRGEFIAAAQDAGRDFTVDWVHLKLNDQAQRTVLCKDPFRSVDERVDRLIASL